MSKRTNRALLAGLAGAVGVVTSTQLPNVQAAMKQLSQQDASASSSQTIGNDPIHQAIKQDLKRQAKNGQHQITTKATIVRERAAAQKKAKASRGPVKAQTSENLVVAQAKTDQESSSNPVELAAAQPDVATQTSSEVHADTSASTNASQSASEQVLAASTATQPSEQADSATTPAEQAAYDEVVTDQSQVTDTMQYTIADGDTLSSIAAAHGVTTADIYAANQGDLGLLQIGQVISIPKTSTHAEGTVTDSAVKSDASVDQTDKGDQAATTQKSENADAKQSDASQQETTSVATDPSNSASTQQETTSAQAPAQQDDSNQEASTSKQSSTAVKTADSSQSSVQAEPEAVTQSNPRQAQAVTNLQVVKTDKQATPTQPIAHATSQAQPVATTHSTQAATPQAPVAVKAGSLSASQRSTIVSEAVSLAQQNIPYVWGGKTTSGFDCSGLVAYVYGQAGASLPAYTVAQEGYVSSQDVHSVADVTAKAQPGDILFWGGHGSTWHSAIYIGGGQFVAAPQPGSNVSVQSLSASFLPDFVGTLN